MATRRDKQRPPKPLQDMPTEAAGEQNVIVENPRKEKLADFLIDVAKYVFTGVVITSLFNGMSDMTVLYLVGMLIVISSFTVGLILTNKTNKKKGE